MADPQAAVLTQLRNIQARTGQTIAALHAALAATGLAKVGEKRSWLMEQYKLGYGDANTVALLVGKLPPGLEGAPVGAPAAAPGDALDAIYSGAKAHLRPLHDTVMQAVAALGPCELAPKKTYISLRRKKQFAMLGPKTNERFELGLNLKDEVKDPRVKAVPPGGMCQYIVPLTSADEVDARLIAIIKRAYEAAG